MNDAPLREQEEKRETRRNDSAEGGFAERSDAEATTRPRAARQVEVAPRDARGDKDPPDGDPGRNLAAKRAMAAELIGMGFSKAQVCRILHLARHELGKRRAAGEDERPAGRSK